MSVSQRKRREAFTAIGGAIRLVWETQAFCDENGLRGMADDLYMVARELDRIRKSIYSPEEHHAQLRLNPHGDRSSRSDHAPEGDRPA